MIKILIVDDEKPKDWKTENTKIPGTIISKIGSIEWWPKKLIKWEIKVNEDEVADIGGYVLKDNLPGNLDISNLTVCDEALRSVKNPLVSV